MDTWIDTGNNIYDLFFYTVRYNLGIGSGGYNQSDIWWRSPPMGLILAHQKSGKHVRNNTDISIYAGGEESFVLSNPVNPHYMSVWKYIEPFPIYIESVVLVHVYMYIVQ